MTGVSNPERTRRADDLLDLVGLGGYGARNVASLSGGEAQRVALARTLAPRPRLILFDEPMGAIDQARKDDLMVQLRTIVDQVGTTSIYVTHDRLEAEAYADTISVLVAGSVIRTDTPPEPLSGTVVSTSFRDGVAELTIDVDGANLRARDPGGFVAGEAVSLRVDIARLIPLSVDEI